MLYSGADLIKNVSSERFERFRTGEPVTAVAATNESGSQMDQDTRDALQRFARFIHRDKKQPSRPVTNLPWAYDQQIRLLQSQGPGALLDIYA